MPFPVKKQRIPASFGHRSVLDRPQLAKEIAAICNSWSFVEARLPQILLAMLAQHSKLGMLMYLAIVSAPARVQVLRNIANAVLPPKRQSELEKLLKDYRKRQDERNAVVHAQWASSDLYPDDLLKIDIPAMLMVESQWAQNRAALIWNMPAPNVQSPHYRYVRYTPTCFQAIGKRIIRLDTQLRTWKEAIETERHRDLSEERLLSVLRQTTLQPGE